ncbi:hypothetical protein AAMO2058_000310300 [Amorphochlora amoebiformis]
MYHSHTQFDGPCTLKAAITHEFPERFDTICYIAKPGSQKMSEHRGCALLSCMQNTTLIRNVGFSLRKNVISNTPPILPGSHGDESEGKLDHLARAHPLFQYVGRAGSQIAYA